ncbi:MAG: hypothetical protein WCW02_04905 [Candidatus Buchananbacteria bacterium]
MPKTAKMGLSVRDKQHALQMLVGGCELGLKDFRKTGEKGNIVLIYSSLRDAKTLGLLSNVLKQVPPEVRKAWSGGLKDIKNPKEIFNMPRRLFPN